MISKLATQVKASKLDVLIYGINKDNKENKGSGGSGGRGGDDGTPGPGPSPPRTPQQEMEDIVRKLNILVGNIPDVSPDNTPAQNSRIIARQNQERFQNRQIKKISNISKGIISKRKSSINFNFPDTPPSTPPQRSNRRDFDEDEKNFPPPPHFIEPTSPPETSFLFSDGSLSPLRNKLSNIAPLPSKPTIDNFARPITQVTDEKNNTIAITPKRPVPKIEEKKLSEQLQSIFPDVNEALTKKSKTFKEKIENLDEIISKVSNIDDDQDKQKIFEFDFFHRRIKSKI